jgi:hypothetical protein
MFKKHHKPEEIVAKLRQVDVMVSQGQPVADAVRAIGVTEVTSRRTGRWRDVLLAQGGTGDHWEVEAPLQHGEALRLPWLQAAGTRACRVHAGCSAPLAGRAVRTGRKAIIPSTFQPDHSNEGEPLL